ncbi:hypothetical protein DYB37_004972 [Aphanomyces astaci]|uniref:Guanylate cyclase domain-containing protein n=1 Tax=Aphanomyces astaci TaxID=112090 RepID=A0A3R6WKT7_APHAT|nr:hypothetical protein DYB35_002755 [Aphanomyces astaci]RHZ05550.1 hypothetical protein DYB37_004972 [Aphanomyces astaci]
MHVGMGFSTVTGNHVGGLLNRWEFYVAGAATGQMSIAEADAHAGELVVSAESYRALVESSSVQPMHIMAEALPTGNYKITDLRSDANVKYTLPTLRLGRDLIPLVKSYVPGCIALSLGKGKIVINGMRSITAIFIKFTGILDIADATEQLHEVHRCLCAVQDAAYRVHGTSVRPGLITSGPAFCGSIGSAVRAEYAVVGDVINLAARLMSMAQPGEILCDDTTHTATLTRFEFDKGTHVMVKGKGDFIEVFQVFHDAVGATSTELTPPGDFFMPSDVYDVLITRIQEFGTRPGYPTMPGASGPDTCQSIVLTGASGAGKTTLLRHLVNVHPNVYYSCGDSVEKNTKLFVWRKVIATIVFSKRHSIIPAPPPPPVDTAQPGSPVTANRRPSTLFRTVTKSPSQLLAAMHKSSLKSLGLNSLNTTTTNTDVAPPMAVLPTPKSRSDGFSVSESQSHVDDGSEAEESSNTFIASTTDLNFGVGLQFVHAIVQSGRLAADLLPLLNVFIPHCFPETSHSLALAQNDERFMHEVTQLVVAILREANERHPILIAWDDCQWIDAASWDLLVHVLGVSPNITCIVGVRPDAPPPHVEFKKLEQVPHTLRFDLQNLSARDTSLFLSHFYGIAIMNSYLLEYVHGRSSGNPGSTIALMQRLLELETIYIDLERGVVHVLKDIHDVDLEISLQTRAKVMHHFDHMNSTSQLAMRITSVAIDYIHFDALHYMLRSVFAFEYNNSFTNPPDTDLNHELLPASLSSQNASIFVQALIGMSHAETHGIIALDHHNETIRFTSDDMRLVVYNVMLPSQRETIHRVFALWFENEVPVHRIPRFQHCYHLAYHLSRAHMYNQAMHYFAKGTEEALLRGVSEFALMCLTSAGAVLLLMDTSHSRHAAPRGLRRTSSSRAMHGGGSDPDDMEVTLHQCKIEFLTGLVMVQKSDWTTAVDNFNAAIAIHTEFRSTHRKQRMWDKPARRVRRWWEEASNMWRTTYGGITKVIPLGVPKKNHGMQIDPSVEKLLDEVESYVQVATRLKTKILRVEREREKTSTAIRLQGLRCISSIKDDSIANLEKTFVLVPNEQTAAKQPAMGQPSNSTNTNPRHPRKKSSASTKGGGGGGIRTSSSVTFVGQQPLPHRRGSEGDGFNADGSSVAPDAAQQFGSVARIQNHLTPVI